MEPELPSLRFQDWLSQQWVIARGRRIDPAQTAWLMGPYCDVIADGYINRLAQREGPSVERSAPTGGMVDSMDLFRRSLLLLPAARRPRQALVALHPLPA